MPSYPISPSYSEGEIDLHVSLFSFSLSLCACVFKQGKWNCVELSVWRPPRPPFKNQPPKCDALLCQITLHNHFNPQQLPSSVSLSFSLSLPFSLSHQRLAMHHGTPLIEVWAWRCVYDIEQAPPLRGNKPSLLLPIVSSACFTPLYLV